MIQTTHYKLNTPCRIALLTDMHDQPWENALRSLETEKPDVICIAGDLLRDDYHSSFEEEVNILPFLRACVSQAPTFFSFGNHEWCMTPEQIEEIKDLGVRVLDNEWTEWTNGTDCNDCTDCDDCTDRTKDAPHPDGAPCSRQTRLLIGGLTPGVVTKQRKPDWRSDPTPPDPKLEWLSEFEKQDGCRLLLCHHPEYYPTYLADRNIDLVFSGHAHGGQWRLFGRGLIAPGQGLFPRLTSGVHPGAHGKLVISRGMGNGTWIPRINNPCEVVIIT